MTDTSTYSIPYNLPATYNKIMSLCTMPSPTVHFSPNTRNPTYTTLTLSSAHLLWCDALHLYHTYSWESSLTYFKRLLRLCRAPINNYSNNLLTAQEEAKLWFNIGILRGLLGEYWLASEAFSKCTEVNASFALGWYALGIARYELKEFRRAKKAFGRCLSVMDYANVQEIEYEISAGEDNTMGFGGKWKLGRTRVDWNGRVAHFEKNWKASRVERPGGGAWGPNGIPVGVIFGPSVETCEIGKSLMVPLNRDNDGLDEEINRSDPELEGCEVRASLTKLARKPSQVIAKPLPPLPSVTVAALQPSNGVDTSAFRSQRIGELRLATTRRIRQAPGECNTSSISVARTTTQSTAVEAKAEISGPSSPIRTVRSSLAIVTNDPYPVPFDSSTTRQSLSLSPWQTPFTEPFPLSPHNAPLLPHELPSHSEVGSRSLASRSFDSSSTLSQSRQTHRTKPSKVDFAYISRTDCRPSSYSQKGLKLTDLGGTCERGYQASLSRGYSSILSLYREEEHTDNDRTANELGSDQNTGGEIEDENEGDAEIFLLPLTYRPQTSTPHRHYDANLPGGSREVQSRTISMYVEPISPRPASSVYSTDILAAAGRSEASQAPSAVYARSSIDGILFSKAFQEFIKK